MKNNKLKKITIDDLAIMVAKGFGDMGARLDTLEKQGDEHNESLKSLEKQGDEHNESLKKIRHDILNIGDRYVSQSEYYGLASRVSRLEEKSRVNKK